MDGSLARAYWVTNCLNYSVALIETAGRCGAPELSDLWNARILWEGRNLKNAWETHSLERIST